MEHVKKNQWVFKDQVLLYLYMQFTYLKLYLKMRFYLDLFSFNLPLYLLILDIQ